MNNLDCFFSYKDNYDDLFLSSLGFIGLNNWIEKYINIRYKEQFYVDLSYTLQIYINRLIQVDTMYDLHSSVYKLFLMYQNKFGDFYKDFNQRNIPEIKIFEKNYGSIILIAK